MKNFTKIIGIITVIAVIGFAFVSCESEEEKAAKAATSEARSTALMTPHNGSRQGR